MASTNMIRHDGELVECIGKLRAAADSAAAHVAIDTEFMRQRTYAPELCLIQLAAGTDGNDSDNYAVCIDPLAVEDLTPLGELLADSSVSKIFHSCRQDLEALDTRVTVSAHNLYDTQLAAAFCGYGDQASYAALVESLCAVHLAKSHTRTDWSRRPLSPEQLEYALDDVLYLPAMRRELDRRLEQKDRIPWLRAECEAAADPATYRLDPDDAWTRLRGVERMDASGRACVRALAAWRERRALQRNLPRGWIMSTPVLLEICRKRPATSAALENIPDMTPRMVKHIGETILATVADAGTGAKSDGEDVAWSPTRMLTPEQRQRVKNIMGLLEERAQQAEISRGLFANRQEVESFVRGQTDLPLFAGWRAELAGDEILERFS